MNIDLETRAAPELFTSFCVLFSFDCRKCFPFSAPSANKDVLFDDHLSTATCFSFVLINFGIVCLPCLSVLLAEPKQVIPHPPKKSQCLGSFFWAFKSAFSNASESQDWVWLLHVIYSFLTNDDPANYWTSKGPKFCFELANSKPWVSKQSFSCSSFPTAFQFS